MSVSLKELMEDAQLPITAEQETAFETYAHLLVEWNERMNLTAITAPEKIAVKHFLDSCMLLRFVTPPMGASMIDVGTGAGFPSVPVKILRPDLKLTLLDSLNKRIIFLKALSEALNQDNTCIHSRAEEGGRQKTLREQYGLATARAVAPLRILAEYCLPYVAVGGTFAALKGYEIEAELEEAMPAIKAMGGQMERVEKYELPGEQRRSIVVIKKISQTSTKYPRHSTKIDKSPIK